MVDKSEKRPATEPEMKKNVGITRVSPAFVKWSDEIEKTKVAVGLALKQSGLLDTDGTILLT